MTTYNINNQDEYNDNANEELQEYGTTDPRLLQDDEETDDADITQDEKEMLDAIESNSYDTDDETLQRAKLDNTDNDGEPLNEKSMGDDFSGEDLDVPGSEDDDDNEAIGEEDEENNNYSNAETA